MRCKAKVVEASGSPYEIGVQYGSAVRKGIRDWLSLAYTRLAQSGTDRTTALEVVAGHVSSIETYSSESVETMRGIARGAELEFHEVLLLNVSLETGLGKPEGCTSFAATEGATENGETIMGQNLDWEPALEEFWVVLNVKPEGFPRILALTVPGCLYRRGMNSTGLGRAGNGLFYRSPHGTSVFSHNRINYSSIVQSKTLSSDGLMKAIEAVMSVDETYSQLPVTSGTMLATKSGEIRYVESVWNDHSIVYPDRDILVHANHYEVERFKTLDMAGKLHEDTFLDELLSTSHTRAARLTKLMQEHYGHLSVELMKELLSDHINYPGSICAHVDKNAASNRHYKTCGSFICNLDTQKMYVSIGNPCQSDFLEYQFQH